jgi:hypothetical protein
VHPDVLEYIRRVAREGAPARYDGPRQRVRAKLERKFVPPVATSTMPELYFK